MTTDAGHISVHLRALLLSLFSYEELHHLASLKREASPGMIARRSLDEAGREELAEMLTGNRTPTVGWWVRRTEKTS